MEFDELLITTGVDALVRLVKERQRIELDEASSILNIPPETIEDWARVLEEESIIRIEYRLTKVYISWVKPTEEEIVREKESFYEEKRGIETEIAQVKEKSAAGAAELADLTKSFSDFYARTYTRMTELEKKVAPVPAAKTISEDMLAKYGEELTAMEAKLSEARGGIDGVKREMAALGIGREKTGSKELLDRLEKANAELLSLKQEMEALRRKAAKEELPGEMAMPTVRDIRKKFEAVQKDFVALRSRNAQIRQDMLSLQESSEILGSVAEAIVGEEDKISALKEEVTTLAKETERLMKNANALATGVKQNADVVERVGSSVETAKGILRKFPSQEKVLQELEKLKADEAALAEKNEAVAKLLEAAGGKQVTARQLADTVKAMDERIAQIKKDMDSLEVALEDEKGTYLTFQKIKERVVPAMEGYEKELDAMEGRVAQIKEEAAAQVESIKAGAQKLQASMKGTDMESALKLAEEVREKRRMLEEIKATLEELATISDNINKRLTLLSREAALLEIRAGGEGAPGGGAGGGGVPTEAKKKELRAQLELTREEELEFRAKREELKKLIQKLWEEQ